MAKLHSLKFSTIKNVFTGNYRVLFPWDLASAKTWHNSVRHARSTSVSVRYCSTKQQHSPEIRDKPQSQATVLRPDTSRFNNLNFDDFRYAFQNKTTLELARALLVLQISASNLLVDNSLKLMTVGRRLLGKRLFTMSMKATIYGQFAAGESQLEILRTVKKLQSAGISTLLGVTIEEDVNQDSSGADSQYDENMQRILEAIDLCKTIGDRRPKLALKITGFMSADLCEKVSKLIPEPTKKAEVVEQVAIAMNAEKTVSFSGLSPEDLKCLNNAIKRFGNIIKYADARDVSVLVDAEFTYINPALNLITLAAMLNFNTRRPLVGYTYQNYLKSVHATLCDDYDLLKANGVCFCAKLVRGAYMDAETRLAKENSYPDPICESFEATTRQYYRSVDTTLTWILENPNRIHITYASHNPDTVLWIIKRLKEENIEFNEDILTFGQVMGMSDHVTYALGMAGYPVRKYIVIGSVEETLPYMSRRAMENRSVLSGTRNERQLLRAALACRLRPWN